MNSQQWKRLMIVIMLVGLTLVLTGIGLIMFTDMRSQGVSGVRTIALTIGAGLLLLIPSKLFLTLLLMNKDKGKLKPGSKNRDS